MDELVFGVPNFRIVNAAFTYARPEGSRFNGGDRGAWYCAFDAETALAEVSFHKTVEYAEINRFDDSVQYQAMLADFTAPFHDLRNQPRYDACLGSGQLHRIANAGGRAPAGRRLAGCDLPQRAARRRHQPGLLPARAGGQCAQRSRPIG
jgi:hypothetical protein